MLFNSLDFLAFGALFFLLWPIMRRTNRRRWGYLVVCSFLFYGWWDWRFLFLILASGFLDYFCALGMEAYPRRRRTLLVLSILGNVGSLAIFKYLGFATHSLNGVLSAIGVQQSIPVLRLTLPVGISFYTFQSMSYTIDVYRGELKPTRSVLHFFAYLAMFPQLVAGPIVRARDLLPQLEEFSPTGDKNRWDGVVLIALGYFKKVVIADNLAPVVDQAFAGGGASGTGTFWWLVVLMFAAQIYCDFSGYSDIARGVAKWMGYEFPRNFNHPYLARSLREFWQRWHISLSTWFRDYVYIPLGGSRRGIWCAHVSMWVTMLLSGIWHGAAWTFLLWGALHASFLSIERVTRWPQRVQRLPLGSFLSGAATLLLVLIGWVLFRSGSASQASAIFARLFSASAAQFNWDLVRGREEACAMLAILAAMEICCAVPVRQLPRFCHRVLPVLKPFAVASLLLGAIFLRGNANAFIYFQF